MKPTTTSTMSTSYHSGGSATGLIATRISLSLAAALLAVQLAGGGCSFIPPHQRPDAPIPTTWPSGAAYQDVKIDPAAPPAASLTWPQFFADARLREVIAVGLENNRDLRLAALNVERAQAMYGIQRAELMPTLNAQTGMSRERSFVDMGSEAQRPTVDRYHVDAGIALWELDFFGRLRSLEAAALHEYIATEEARRSAQVLLVSSIARAYLALAADRENLRIAQTTLQAQRGTYDLVKRRFERGLVPELDVHRAQTQVDAARGGVARFTQIVAQGENALNLLVGQPVPRALQADDLDQVRPPRDIAMGIPSEVLLDRPDVLEAENRLRAADANIGAARSAFFPRISLTAIAGAASNDLAGLFNAGSGTWRFAPQVVVPIFDARTRAALRVTETDRKIAVAQYERVIQESFREVADALAVYGTVNEQLAAQESLVRAVAETYRLSNARYDKGVDSYLSVLDAQRSLYTEQQQLVRMRLAKMANQVTLYAVLGGGWQFVANPATKPAPTTAPAAQD